MNRAASIALLAAALAVVRTEAQVVRPVVHLGGEYARSVTIDDAGTAVYAVTTTNQFGTNPEYREQVVRWDPVTGTGTPITDYEEGVKSVSVSDDGTWLALVSRVDPLGTNHDESAELYVIHPDGTDVAQLTSGSFDLLEMQGPLSRGVRAAVISGSANRIIFVGRIDPLGTNPLYTNALFAIDRDGSNLRQLATGVSGPGGLDGSELIDISDDGSRVVYPKSGELYGINANGTANHLFSDTTSVGAVAIAGNGAKIVYQKGFSLGASVRARTFDGNPGTIVTVGSGESPSITDDASTVYYYRHAAGPAVAGIWRVASTGGAQTLIAPDLRTVRVSGNGSRIVARGTELVAIDNTGGSLTQLTTTTVFPASIGYLTMSSDLNLAHFVSNMDPLGTNPAHNYEYFSYGMDTGQFWERTDASLPNLRDDFTSVSDDGSIFFQEYSDLTGQNPCGHYQVFRLSPLSTYTQLTSCDNTDNYAPEVRPDGQVLAFLGDGFQLLSVHADGTGRTQLTPSGTQVDTSPDSFSVAGTGPVGWVAFTANNDIFRVKTDGTGLQLVTNPAWTDSNPSISADGSVIAWYSDGDYAGLNADASSQVFVHEATTQTFQQITGGPVGYPVKVTQDGEWVFVGLGRFRVDTGIFEYAAGLQGGYLYPDATGSRWVIQSDYLYLADTSAAPTFVVGKPSPTVLSWDPSPFSLRYDVIRGSIANLSTAGSTVSLGPVSCLEDDSPDSHTRGYGDPVDPAPGQAFFYLYRGSVGFNAAAGSYGQGTGGKERIAGSGGCNP